MNGMNKNGYERYDACYGKVNSVCRAGAFVILDDGETAFCYNAAGLPLGTKIICTVLKDAREGKRMLVGMDSRVDDECGAVCSKEGKNGNDKWRKETACVAL